MKEERLKGVIDEVVGTVKRKAGELTGDTKIQVEGMAQQARGKIENALGKAIDTVSDSIPHDSI